MDQLAESNYCCHCETVTVSPKAKPLVRFICHCETCQRYTKQPFSDECFFLYKDVQIENIDHVTFKKYQSNFSPLQRGLCNTCNKPAISIASVSSMLKFALLPTESVSNVITLPPVSAHVFYHRRISSINDSVPKYSGYWRSQLATQWLILKSCIVRNRHA